LDYVSKDARFEVGKKVIGDPSGTGGVDGGGIAVEIKEGLAFKRSLRW